jgi:PAS domain S-box-containing protein
VKDPHVRVREMIQGEVSKRSLRVLLVEDTEDDATLALHELRRGGYEPAWERVDTAAGLTDALARRSWDIVLCDYVLPQFSASAALDLLRRRGCDLPVIIVSGQVGEEVAADAMRAGAHDYVSKNNLARLNPAVEREIREAEGRRARKRAEDALRESEDRYRDLVEHSQDLMCTHDLHGRILSVNAAPARALGYEQYELLAKRIQDLLAPEFRAQFAEYMAALRRDGVATGLMTVLTKNGERRTWEYRNTLRTSGVAAPIVRGMARDVTARIQAESARRQLQARVAEEIRERTAQRADADRELGAFLVSVARELRVPLDVIEGCRAALLEECGGRIGAAGRRHLERVRQATDRMAELIEGLRARPRAGRD